MALPASGPISMSQVNAELGISPVTTLIALGQTTVRTLFGKASGAIKLSDGYGKSNNPYPNSATFSSNGTWTVPSGVSNIYVKAWAGGGSAGYEGNGGGGGYFEAKLSVTAGQSLGINVPGTANVDVDDSCECYTEDNVTYARVPNNSGGGGGAAVVLYPNNNASAYVIVGGGGGGATGGGGAGGGSTGGSGGSVNFYGGGGGGTDSAGGIGRCAGTFHSGTSAGVGCMYWNTALVYYCDNAGAMYGGGGGRGGDGWGGGGGAYGATAQCDSGYPGGGGGGGGSTGYTGGWTDVINSQADGDTPAQTGNSDYPGDSIAYGGRLSQSIGDYGRAGYVVIRY